MSKTRGQSKPPAAGKGPAAKKASAKAPAKEAFHRPPAPEISDEIVKLIEDEVFLPGERLREQDLADRFGVTRGRIREVLHNLEARGFVEIERMKGATIVRHDRREFAAIGQVRAAMVALAARRAANEATEAERDEILKQAKELAAKGPDMSAQDYRLATIKLTGAICDGAHSLFLRRILDDVHRVPSNWRAYRNLIVASRDRRTQSSKSWKSVADAIVRGESDKAATLVEEIYARGFKAMQELIDAGDGS
ncbi:GntR family transcriptional regulator [Parvibaculum sp.]|uniref:GntR family transcriptional regulator n=1 Tax=Parvibaculum sp. TaxID=2024848 RepID=UPI002730D558|nr:GntR family transcriptional regulator [Parvibaculum sp.]MDP1626579.1 GntR family transcriptional regulator [Parvibaculum sp.]MDP2150501.1 GntR family transcriptional regulator [Parvibaculum sp.]MDP3327013.1 GntR family transcriptional regulator [Parvibaculum sp.]